jgi:hypothetical protein
VPTAEIDRCASSVHWPPYPRTVQRRDGKIVTVYYFHDRPKSDRYIAATIWDAGK